MTTKGKANADTVDDGMSPGVIDDVSDVTPSWLTAALAASGFDVTVGAVTTTPIGTGQMGSTYRLELDYERGVGPARLVVKLPSTDPSSRAAGSMGYRAEANFYRAFSSEVRVRVPRCYYADVRDDASGFTLLLEDLAPAEQGDQIAGCTVDEARAALLNVVGLHAPTWCDPSLYELDWIIPSHTSAADLVAAYYRDANESFLANHVLQDSTADILSRFARDYARWTTGRTEPFSLVHNDYRLDNLMFAPPGSADPVTAVDWQVTSVGRPLHDVAVLIATGLPSTTRAREERELVELYHRALVDSGVDYDQAECWDDYRYSLFYGLHLTVFGAFTAKATERGNRMFSVMAERTAAAIAELDAFSLLD